jgi:hypothetical protein
LLKEPKTPADLRRLDEIEAAILHEYGPQWFEITGKQ